VKFPQLILVPTGNTQDIRTFVNPDGPLYQRLSVCNCCRFFAIERPHFCTAFLTDLEELDMLNTAPNLKAVRCLACLDAEFRPVIPFRLPRLTDEENKT